MGKNKKPKSIGRLIIDLTPLLDVIFIVLIVVLAGQDTFNMEADQKFAEAEVYVSEADKKLDEMEALVDTYAEQMAAYDSLSDYFNAVTVYASYSLENRRLRTVYVMINNEEPVTLNLTPSNTAETWAECKRMIEEVIKKDETLPMILSINSNGDEKMLLQRQACAGILSIRAAAARRERRTAASAAQCPARRPASAARPLPHCQRTWRRARRRTARRRA